MCKSASDESARVAAGAHVKPCERVPGTCAWHASRPSVRVSLEMGGFKQLLSTLTFNQGLSTASTVKHGLSTWIVQSYSPGGYL